MICSASFKSGKACTYRAKKIIRFDGNQNIVSNRHVLEEAMKILGRKFASVVDLEDVDEVSDIDQIKSKKREQVLDVMPDAILIIKATTGLDIEKDGPAITAISGVEYHPVRNKDEKLMLTICKKEDLREDLYEAMCVQVGIRSCDVFLPIKSYEVLGQHYFVSKLVRPKNNDKASIDPYFYQLSIPSKPLREAKFDNEKLKEFTIHMCALIQSLHSSRMCFGDYNDQSVVLTDLTDPKTAYIDSAKYITFWRDAHGEFKSQDRKIPGTKAPLTSSRRVHSKQAPGRYDDFESLLFLIFTLQGKILPWNGETTLRTVIPLKEEFLKDPNLYIETEASQSLKILCKMITSAEYEERPNYNRIVKLLSAIALSD